MINTQVHHKLKGFNQERTPPVYTRALQKVHAKQKETMHKATKKKVKALYPQTFPRRLPGTNAQVFASKINELLERGGAVAMPTTCPTWTASSSLPQGHCQVHARSQPRKSIHLPHCQPRGSERPLFWHCPRELGREVL